MCILIIELIWVPKYGKMGEKPPFLEIFEGWYRYQIERYRYRKCSVNWYRYQLFYFGQCSYFGYNFVISDPI